MKVMAYLRTSEDAQDLAGRRLEILNYARKHHMALDEIVEVDMSTRKDEQKPHVAEVMDLLRQGDMLIVQTDGPEK